MVVRACGSPAIQHYSRPELPSPPAARQATRWRPWPGLSSYGLTSWLWPTLAWTRPPSSPLGRRVGALAAASPPPRPSPDDAHTPPPHPPLVACLGSQVLHIPPFPLECPGQEVAVPLPTPSCKLLEVAHGDTLGSLAALVSGRVVGWSLGGGWGGAGLAALTALTPLTTLAAGRERGDAGSRKPTADRAWPPARLAALRQSAAI